MGPSRRSGMMTMGAGTARSKCFSRGPSTPRWRYHLRRRHVVRASASISRSTAGRLRPRSGVGRSRSRTGERPTMVAA